MAKINRLPGYAVSRLAEDLKHDRIGGLYLFWGEESYLKEYYISEITKKLCGDDETALRVLAEKNCTPQNLADSVMSMPFLSQHTLCIVRNVDILAPDAALAAAAPGILEDMPDETCVIFVWGAEEPGGTKPNKKLQDLFAVHGKAVCFNRPEPGEMNRWIRRRFAALGKSIAQGDADYLASLTGGLMFSTIPEIEKIGAFCEGDTVTKKEIDAVVTPVTEAVMFRLTDALAAGSLEAAEKQLEVLMAQKLQLQEALTQIGAAMRRLYAARLAIDSGKGRDAYMNDFGVRSSYAADIHFRQARAFGVPALRRACMLCEKAEQDAMFGRVNDRVALDTLIYQLCKGLA